MSEKTEQPTTQRLQKSRDDGDSGVSGFASQALAFLVAVTLLFTTNAYLLLVNGWFRSFKVVPAHGLHLERCRRGHGRGCSLL